MPMKAAHVARDWRQLCFGVSTKRMALDGPAAQTLAVPPNQLTSRRGSVKAWLALALLGFGMAQAQTVLCRMESGSDTSQLSLTPVADAYALSSVDLPNGFRVSAQWFAVTNRLKTYFYYTAAHAPVLISQQVLALPANMCTMPFSQQMVYAGKIERELTLTCQLQCN